MVKLVELLKEKNKKCSTDFESNIHKLKAYLEGATLPYYTAHGIEHSESLIDNFDKLIPDKLKKEMNEMELFILLSSAYFHDIGMAVKLSDEDVQRAGQSKEDYDKRLDFIRRTHSERIYRFLINSDNQKEFNLDKGTASVLAKICRAHSDNKYRKEDGKYKEVDDRYKSGGREYTFRELLKEEPQKAVNKYNVRIHLLAALLRLSDELDVNYSRTYDNLENKRKIPLISEIERKKNKLISGIEIDSEKFEIVVDIFEEELYKGGKENAQNNKALTEVIVKLRSSLLEVSKTLHDHDLKYRQIEFQDQVIKNLQKTLKDNLGIEKNSQPIYDDQKYDGAMLQRFYYKLESFNLSPEYIVSNDIDFLFSGSDSFIRKFDSMFMKYRKEKNIEIDITPIKIDILRHLNQISFAALSETDICDISKLPINYKTIIESMPEQLLETGDSIIRRNLPNLIKKWDDGKLSKGYYLSGIQKEILANIIKDKYSYLRRENFKRKCKDHFIYFVFSETYFVNIFREIIVNKIPIKSRRTFLENKLREIKEFIENEENKNIRFYYHNSPLDAESKLLSSELAFENSITNDSVIVINNINVVTHYYKKFISFLKDKDTWQVKTIYPERLKFVFNREDEFYIANKEYKDAFIEKDENCIFALFRTIRGIEDGN